MAQQVKRLEAFPKDEFSRDVIMPIKPDTKQPAFAHKDGTWTWNKFKELKFKPTKTSLKSSGIGVLLRDLCVIDVDDVKIADALEAEFPILTHVPCETTSHGRHYWFQRPERADELCIYDGPGQVREKIDFKPVCATGTSGFIVVAPSTGKTWQNGRAIWEVAPIEMPMELLLAVARPAARIDPLRLTFEDDVSPFETTSPWIRSMSYFDPFIDNEDTLIACTVLVPCRRAPFLELLHALSTNEIGASEPTRELFEDMAYVADKLGLPASSYEHRLACGQPRSQLDMYEICPDWWISLATEKAWWKAPNGDEVLMDVDADMAASLMYEPLTVDADVVHFLSEIPTKSKSRNKRVLVSDPVAEMEDELPPVVLDLLTRYPGKIVLAGGAPLGIVGRRAGEGSDYDLYLVGVDEAEAVRIVDEIRGIDGIRTTFVSQCAITFVLDEEDLCIQIIARLYDDVAQVLLGFDQAPSKIATYIHPLTGLLVVKCALTWVPVMKHMAFAIDTTCWSLSGTLRALKYFRKGFAVYLPGGRRSAVKMPLPASQWYAFLWTRRAPPPSYGVMGMLQIEQTIDRQRKQTRTPITNDEYSMAVKKFRYTSDYTVCAKIVGGLAHVLRRLFDGGRKLIGIKQIDKDAKEFDPIVFVRCDKVKRCTCPTPARFGEAFDLAQLKLEMARAPSDAASFADWTSINA